MESFDDFLNSDQINYHKNLIPNFNDLITKSELKAIYDGLDKTDYSVMAKPRWLDLDDILERIIDVKSTHKNMILNKISIKMIHERFPPINDYEFFYEIKN
jgi:hypothetical protein